jgi:nitrogenase molybdenum-iron protein NifN
MAKVITSTKQCMTNPLRLSQPLGAALAFLGMDRCMPLLHGAQGCTSFGLVLLVRHFREAIPLQTTAMTEVTTVLGGIDNVEQGILNIWKKTNPDLIGICTTGTTEVKGDDLNAYITLIRARHPELDDVELVHVNTPDFSGAFQDGWARAVTRMIEELVEIPELGTRDARRVNVLPGSHLTPGDIDELREMIEAFGLIPTFLPDLSGSLDGHIPSEFTPTTLGGCGVDEVHGLGSAAWTIAIGAQMRGAAITLEHRTGVPYRLFERLTGLECSDKFMEFLSRISGVPVPRRYRRLRGQLVDAMLDGHFYFGDKRVAIAAEPDLLWTMSMWLHEMGCQIVGAVTSTMSPLLEDIPADEVILGDLQDLEVSAAGADLIVANSQARQAADRLHVPLFRMGMPIFDRLGTAHITTVGYRATRDLIFAIGNTLMAVDHEPTQATWVRDDMELPQSSSDFNILPS